MRWLSPAVFLIYCITIEFYNNMVMVLAMAVTIGSGGWVPRKCLPYHTRGRGADLRHPLSRVPETQDN